MCNGNIQKPHAWKVKLNDRCPSTKSVCHRFNEKKPGNYPSEHVPRKPLQWRRNSAKWSVLTCVVLFEVNMSTLNKPLPHCRLTFFFFWVEHVNNPQQILTSLQTSRLVPILFLHLGAAFYIVLDWSPLDERRVGVEVRNAILDTSNRRS